jgi:hypothetical protein
VLDSCLMKSELRIRSDVTDGLNLLYKAHVYSTRSELGIVSRHVPLGAVDPSLPQAVPRKISVLSVSNDTDQRQYNTWLPLELGEYSGPAVWNIPPVKAVIASSLHP